MTTELPADRLAGAYIKLRTKREELKKAFEDEDNVLKDKMEKLKGAMLAICNEQNASSIKTGHGTIIRSTKTRYWTDNWGAMYGFIMENEVPELLEKRIAQKNMAQYLEEHPDLTPAGLNQTNEYDVTVRKA